jgi:sporulation protein YlmC with PRC-barrel domain
MRVARAENNKRKDITMKAKFLVNAAVAVAALLAASPAEAAHQLGKIESAKKVVGREIQTTQGEKVGELKDVVVDLESGRVLYTIVSAGGFLGINDELTAVAPSAFSSSGEAKLTINADKEKLTAAPRFTKDHESNLKDAGFAKQVYQHFGQNLDWEQGSFNNVHKASELIGMNVKNSSDQNIGEVSDLGIDLPAGRVTFVILGAGGVLGAGEKHYVMPPNAFTLASDNKSLVSGIDKEKLADAPQLQRNNWQQLSDRSFAARVYQHYGKQPYWTGATLTPTGREESRTYEKREANQRDRISRDRNDDSDLHVRRAPPGHEGARGTGEFANVEEASRLIGMNVENARGVNIGKLTDIVVDLDSGRVLYGVVDLSGRAGSKAVAPQSLSLGNDDKSLRFTGDQSKLNAAPPWGTSTDPNNAQFAGRVYTHFGQQHDWFEASRNFRNARRATEVMKAKVENSQNENVGQIQNLMVDLPQGRVLYVILSAAPMVGRGNHLLAVPPNAFTPGSDRNTLLTGLDKAKLEGAPRFSRTNLRELTTPAKAAEIYRYYDKQAYWNTGGLTPTGR